MLGTTPDRIRFHALQMGGGFGRRTMFVRELLRDALVLSRQVRRPVKVMWTREDDVKNSWFRPATAQKLRAALDANGRVTAWHHRIACPSIADFYSPDMQVRANYRDLFVMEGSQLSEYGIPHVLAEHVIMERRARIAAWRGIGAGHNAFAAECFIDELAAAAKLAPVTFRRRLLRENRRATAVLDRVVAMADFGRPATGRMHGVSLAPYKTSLAAGVAEISLDRSAGAIRVHRFWAAVDAGLPIQPRNLMAQVEGGIVFGLSGLLKERITIKQGEVQQSNFHDYRFMRASEVPEIEVQIVHSDAPPSGAGELGVPGNGTIGRAEPLGLPWRLESLHAPFPLVGGLMGVLRPVIQIPMLAMFYTRQELALGGSITLQLIRDDDPWSALATLEQLAEECLRSILVSPALHQDIEDMAILIHSPPEMMTFARNGEEDFIEAPLVARFGGRRRS